MELLLLFFLAPTSCFLDPSLARRQWEQASSCVGRGKGHFHNEGLKKRKKKKN